MNPSLARTQAFCPSGFAKNLGQTSLGTRSYDSPIICAVNEFLFEIWVNLMLVKGIILDALCKCCFDLWASPSDLQP